MKRFLTFVVMVLALVMPAYAWAGTPYVINWVMVEENPKCETAHLLTNGAYVDVNATHGRERVRIPCSKLER